MVIVVDSEVVYVLGIHQSGPISSAAILKNGNLIAGIAEERITRIKQDRNFPHNAIDFCLNSCGIDIGSVNQIAIGWNPGENVALKCRDGFSQWMRYPGEWLSSVPNNLLPLYENDFVSTDTMFEDINKKKTTVHFIDHHMSHARLAYEIAGKNECAILVVDGWSEQKVTTWMHAKNGGIEIIQKEIFPNSIGCFYAAITDFLGYQVFQDEWKVMGMAAYGNAKKIPQISELIHIKSEGSYELNLSYFDFYNFDRSGFFSSKMESLLGAKRKSNERLCQHHFDIAAACQYLFQQVMDNACSFLYDSTGCDTIAIAGGAAMNCLYNGSITKNTKFSNCSVSFAPDDSGNSIGAALEVAYRNRMKINMKDQTSAIGIEFSEEKIGNVLEKYKLKYRVSKNIIDETAEFLACNKVVGWFQGKSEFGQRALGHRSILASPIRPEMKNVLNDSIKFREFFRPFAPMILKERVNDYFDAQHADSVYYMEKALKYKKKIISLIPATVHKDETGRLQVVDKKLEPLLHGLLIAFEKKTGVPVVINTSFNLNGEPIVNSIEDALRTFFTSGLDILVCGHFIIEKKHM